MVPVYLIIGLINIFSQHHNYGIKIDDPNIDIRVRRSIEDTAKLPVLEIPTYVEKAVLKREKRDPYYKKTIITDNDILKNSERRIQRNVGNRYDIFNSNYSFINFTRNNQNNTGITNNNKPVSRPNPYRYPKSGYTAATTTSGYRNQNDNTPEYYNYQNPSGRNFAGYAGYTDSPSGYNGATTGYYSAPTPYAPRSSRPNNYPLNNAQASFQLPTNSAQPTGNSNNGLYNNLAVNNKENLPQYAVNYNNAYSAPNNGHAPASNGFAASNNRYAVSSNGYAPSSNGNTAPSNGYVPASWYTPGNNEYAGSSNGYAPAGNGYAVPNNGNTAPNNGYVVPSNANPASNTYVTPSQNDYVFPSINDYNTTPGNVFPSATTNATPSNVIPSTTIVTPSSNSTGTTTEEIIIKRVCVICNIRCPKFMKRFGNFCMDENYNDY